MEQIYVTYWTDLAQIQKEANTAETPLKRLGETEPFLLSIISAAYSSLDSWGPLPRALYFPLVIICIALNSSCTIPFRRPSIRN
jgi:hypothetical protein